MSIFFASLNSGSNGNCYYVGNDREAVLIDAGISCKETEKRMRELRLPIEKVKAIFISHEHIDHVKGVEVLAGRFGLPVYITPATLNNSRTKPPAHLAIPLHAHTPITIGEMTVVAFPKNHDAIDPHSFMVSCQNINIGVFTDIGAVCDNVIHYFGQCHAAFLEANYDDDMLEKGKYPYHLRKRISGEKGHLSNIQALELFSKYRSPQLSHLLLSHLSKDNNHPDVALACFAPVAGKTNISVASRYAQSEIYQIRNIELGSIPPRQTVVQATLF